MIIAFHYQQLYRMSTTPICTLDIKSFNNGFDLAHHCFRIFVMSVSYGF